MDYTFKESDLVICKPRGGVTESNEDFCIYARVVKVDRENDSLFLDRYLRHGATKLCGKKDTIYERSFREGLPLSRVEEERLYQPMELSEIEKFCDGLKEGLEKRSYQFYRGIHDRSLSEAYKSQTEETLAIVEKRVELERCAQKTGNAKTEWAERE